MSNSVHVNVGGTWKTASDYYVNVGGTWKTGSAIGPNVSSAWKGFGAIFTTTDLKLNLKAGDSTSYSGSGTTWTDLTSEDNDGTISGATFTYSNERGGIFNFDGTNDAISISDDASIEFANGDFTFEAWINVDANASSYNCILSKNAPIQIYWHDNQIKVWANNTDSTSGYNANGISSGSNSLMPHGWHHIVVTRSGGENEVWKIYIDKVEKVSTTISGFTIADTTATAYIGNYGGDQYFFNGQIAQVRMYKGTALTASQITDNYTLTKDPANLKLDLAPNNSASYSGSGTTWTDLTANDNDGTISGATLVNSTHGSVFDFDGTNDHIQIPDSDDWHIDTDYTIEVWFLCEQIGGGYNAVLAQWEESNNSSTNSWVLEFVSTNLRFYYIPDGSTYSYFELGTSNVDSKWHHFALTRSGTTAKIFLDNSQVGSDFTMNTLQDGTGPLTIGGDVAGAGWFNGQISDVRIYKGKALTTAQLDISYNETKAIKDLKIYLDGVFSDSYNGSGTTWYDLVSISPTAKSVDFDGTDDYLTTTQAYIDKSDSFCVEAWVNWDDTGNSSDMGMICSQYEYQDGRMLFGSQSGNCVVRINGGDVELETGSNTISTGTWYHVAWTWDGTTHRLFLDGILKDSSTSNFNIYTGTETEIGGQSTLGSGNFWIDGKISNFRIVQGDTVYGTSNFVPSKSPLKRIAGTVLLCCQDDSSATAATVSSGTITAAGSPSVSTDHPFGNNATITGATWDSSNKFFELDGTDDRFNITSTDHAPGTGDFAITSWVRFAADNTCFVWDTRSATNEDDGFIFFYWGASDDSWRVWTNGESQIASSANAVSLNTWYHTVVTRISGTTTLYINGTSIGSFNDSFNYSHDDIVIGNNVTNATYWEGDVSSFRAYKYRGLTAADVTAQFNAQKSRFGY